MSINITRSTILYSLALTKPTLQGYKFHLKCTIIVIVHDLPYIIGLWVALISVDMISLGQECDFSFSWIPTIEHLFIFSTVCIIETKLERFTNPAWKLYN